MVRPDRMEDVDPIDVQMTRAWIETEVEHRLKPDLDVVCGLRDKVFEQIMVLLQLRQNVQLLKENGSKDFEMQVNIGEDFYMRAAVEDTSKLGVDIGLGVHVEMTLDEAITFTNEKQVRLDERSEKYTKRITEIQGHLQLLLRGLSQVKPELNIR